MLNRKKIPTAEWAKATLLKKFKRFSLEQFWKNVCVGSDIMRNSWHDIACAVFNQHLEVQQSWTLIKKNGKEKTPQILCVSFLINQILSVQKMSQKWLKPPKWQWTWTNFFMGTVSASIYTSMFKFLFHLHFVSSFFIRSQAKSVCSNAWQKKC